MHNVAVITTRTKANGWFFIIVGFFDKNLLSIMIFEHEQVKLTLGFCVCCNLVRTIDSVTLSSKALVYLCCEYSLNGH